MPPTKAVIKTREEFAGLDYELIEEGPGMYRGENDDQ
jgi:hypothetical protein